MGKILGAVAAAVLIATSAGTARALAPGSAPAVKPVFPSEVSLVLLPIFVVDRDGHAVRGLRAEDFELEEDGRRMEIVSFRDVDTTSPEGSRDVALAPAARRRFLLLFDKSFTVPGGLRRAQKAALTFVREQMAPSDLVAVAAFDINNGMKVVANFTDDRALLAHAVETLGVPTLSRVNDPLGLAADLAVTDIAVTGRSADDTSTDRVLDSVLSVLVKRIKAADDQAYRSNVQTLLASFRSLAVALRGVEGRKQVLFFSAGFDSRLLVGERGTDLKESSQAVAEGRIWDVDTNARFGDSNIREGLTESMKALSNADTVMHTIDVSGLAQDSALDRMKVPEAVAGEGAGREALSFIATETGGRAFKDANDLDPVLKELLEMTSRFYVVGYQPGPRKAPGAFHRIRVKVLRKGARVSHRAGYFERRPRTAQTALERQFEAAQLVVTGAGPQTLPFSALAVPVPFTGGAQGLTVVLQVPRERLQWTRAGRLGMELYAYAVGEDGVVRDHLAQVANVDLAKADPADAARGVSIAAHLRLAPGRYTVRLMLAETATGAEGSQFLDVVVPPRDPRHGFLLPPVLMEEAGRWIALQVRPPAGGASPFVAGEEPFLPRASFEVRSGHAERLALIAYDAEGPRDPAGSVEIRASLTDGSGKAVPAGPVKLVKVHRAASGRRTYVLDYTPEGLAPGDYTLRVAIAESGADIESFARLRVRPDGGG